MYKTNPYRISPSPAMKRIGVKNWFTAGGMGIGSVIPLYPPAKK